MTESLSAVSRYPQSTEAERSRVFQVMALTPLSQALLPKQPSNPLHHDRRALDAGEPRTEIYLLDRYRLSILQHATDRHLRRGCPVTQRPRQMGSMYSRVPVRFPTATIIYQHSYQHRPLFSGLGKKRSRTGAFILAPTPQNWPMCMIDRIS